ncbi:GNAT family N-acetyltransferase [Dyadobacter jejuensis]|nr:GNAT family N-acetyltransferase [Dyadobacter jejuensis]
MKLELLADHPNLLPIIAKWYFEEWGCLSKDKTLDTEIENLQAYLNPGEIPLILIAIGNGQPLGAAQLKYHEMSIYPDKVHWLGGVYVSQEHRGKGIASQIILELIAIAKKLKIKTLYLQTENLSGGLYRQLGWLPIEQVNYHGIEVLVMELIIKD